MFNLHPTCGIIYHVRTIVYNRQARQRHRTNKVAFYACSVIRDWFIHRTATQIPHPWLNGQFISPTFCPVFIRSRFTDKLLRGFAHSPVEFRSAAIDQVTVKACSKRIRYRDVQFLRALKTSFLSFELPARTSFPLKLVETDVFLPTTNGNDLICVRYFL